MSKNYLKKKEALELVLKDEFFREYYFRNANDSKYFKMFLDKGLFSPTNNPKPTKVKNGYQIPEWNALQYLGNISKRTRSYDQQLLEIIRDVSLYKDSNGKHIDNYRTWWYFVKILLNIPLSKIPYEVFTEAMPTWLTSIFDITLPGADLTDDLLPAFLKQIESKDDIKKVEKLVELLLGIKEIKLKKGVLGETLEVQTKIDAHWLEESFIAKNNASLIAQKCTNAPIFNLADKIREIFNKKHEKQDYSSIWLRDLTREQTKSLYNAEYFLAVILHKLVIEKVKHNKKEGTEIIEKFLSDTYPHTLFKRLAIVLISAEWNSYSKYFDQILEDKSENYFGNDSFAPEIAHLLRENVQEFTEEQKTKLEKIIEKGPTEELPDTKKEEYKLHWKQSLYRILDTDPEFKAKYEEIKKTTRKDVKLPEFGDVGVFREVEFDKSPITAEGFLTKTNKEILNYIDSYKPKGDFPNFSPEGVYRTFQSAIELSPEKFTQDLASFKTQNYHLLSSLFNGLEEAWKQKKDILWKEVVRFTIELLHEEWFWKPTEEDRNKHYDYFSWTLSAIGDLLQEGCKTDEWAFDESLHESVEKIIAIMLDKLPYDDETYKGIGIDHALNSSWGKLLTALIYLGLREARLSDKKSERKDSKWSKSLKNSYEGALKKGIYEAYTLLGEYLHNIYYIDKEWAIAQAKKIHKVKDDKQLESFMDGYLFSGRVYEHLYKILGEAYGRALTLEFKEVRIKERLIQHITVGYVRGNEELEDDSLINKIIKTDNSKYIREIVEFMWHQKDYIVSAKSDDEKVEKEKAEFKTRVITFWDYVLKTLEKKKKLSNDDKKILSELGKLAIYLLELDKIGYKRLLASAPYVTVDFDSPYFIEYLNKLKDKGDKKQSAIYVGKLFLEMLNGYTELTPDYKWDDVVEIVIHLYGVGESNDDVKDLANQICIFYAEHRNLRLREIYEKYNEISKK